MLGTVIANAQMCKFNFLYNTYDNNYYDILYTNFHFEFNKNEMLK